ncbi:MAG: alginate lyase family protein [Myxococcaceae bacterium]
MFVRQLLLWTSLLAAGPVLAAPLAFDSVDLPEVLFSDPDALISARAEARSGGTLSPALHLLHSRSEAALAVGPFTVTDKPQLAPSGDLHDYMSLGRYWWPDPTKPDGLPYVELDGRINPETGTITDKAELQALLPAVSTLAHAYLVFGDERYAEHAARLLRTWFLDPATRMNPNLEYSQLHKGHVELGGSGIIDSRDFAMLPEAVGLLKGSPAWSAEDDAALRQWFTQYLDWMLNTEGGRAEEALTNNHRTWYWYQAVPLLLYTGQAQRADDVFRNVLLPSLAEQIEPDGSQPQELSRTKGFSYSIFNLMAWSRLAHLAKARGVDLWHHELPDGRGSLRRAFTYLLPYLRGERAVTDNPVVPERPYDLARLLHRAAPELGEPGWSELARSIMGARSDELELDLILAPATR